MLNIELVDSLYAGLPKEQQQKLITLLFKNSKQSMSYFKRTKDISLSKLETLADFFNMPLDDFRVARVSPVNHVGGNNMLCGTSFSKKLLMDCQLLKNELESLKNTLKAKEEILMAKDETIKAKSEMIEVKNDIIEGLRAQIASMN